MSASGSNLVGHFPKSSTVVVIGLFVVELTVVPVIPTVEVSEVLDSALATGLYKLGFDT